MGGAIPLPLHRRPALLHAQRGLAQEVQVTQQLLGRAPGRGGGKAAGQRARLQDRVQQNPGQEGPVHPVQEQGREERLGEGAHGLPAAGARVQDEEVRACPHQVLSIFKPLNLVIFN